MDFQEEKAEAINTGGSAKSRLSINNDDTRVESFDKDLAAAIVSNHAHEYDTRTGHQVLRKIDLRLIPWMWFGYGFVYYDKVR